MFSEALEAYQKSGLKMYSHIFSTAQTFNLSDWSISQMIFSKHLGDTIDVSLLPPSVMKGTKSALIMSNPMLIVCLHK
ncbi:hypothetical protein [Helicobacter bilis]|uniref:hypothetical protein n=1 Tax=Helicobacter bilis TaxID=37372 RepID=UPI0026EC15A6|nr:hypothetical protein [Helicobacter bilis]MCI7411853.1 hypothetical protein [Helicobacter bilis]MDD7296765.1 hypothetical protein [Helicobacter bilis]MDY4399123.1 hypothetical protein [Helicobacter bilis]